MGAELPSLSTLKFASMIENVTPHSFEGNAQLDDIRHLLEAAHRVGLMGGVAYGDLLRLIEAKRLLLAEAARKRLDGASVECMWLWRGMH